MKKKSFLEMKNLFVRRDFLVIGAGSSIKKYEDEIRHFIAKENVITLGINNMNCLCPPDFNLWTNNQRYCKFGNSISPHSKLLFGCGIPYKTIKKHYKKEYFSVDFEDKPGLEMDMTGEIIKGYFRTAGGLSIALCHLMGANNIYIVGMDGYTFYKKKDLKAKKVSHHCYGKGYTDDASWEKCKIKDVIVNNALRALKNYGISFKVITPTVFEQFYDARVLNLSMNSEGGEIK